MSCQNCENKIKGNLRFEKGVKKIETNLSEQRITIEYDADKTCPEKLEEALQKIGYKASVIDSQNQDCNKTSETPACSGNCCKGKSE